MPPKHPPRPPMTLGNMRELRVQQLLASCLSAACRHVALIDVSHYPADTSGALYNVSINRDTGPELVQTGNTR